MAPREPPADAAPEACNLPSILALLRSQELRDRDSAPRGIRHPAARNLGTREMDRDPSAGIRHWLAGPRPPPTRSPHCTGEAAAARTERSNLVMTGAGTPGACGSGGAGHPAWAAGGALATARGTGSPAAPPTSVDRSARRAPGPRASQHADPSSWRPLYASGSGTRPAASQSADDNLIPPSQQITDVNPT